jgi:glyoxylase-like metal-dependent hydrolase (beta-lactamase superfamily II)
VIAPHQPSLVASPASEEILAKGIARLDLRTPTLPPATSTNALVVGEQSFVVIEPATPHADQQARLCAAIESRIGDGARFIGVLITHHHLDHVGAVEILRRRYSVPVFAHPLTAERVDFYVDEQIEDGWSLTLGEQRIAAIFTPGHAPGHIVYAEERERLAYAGDMVAGEGTVVVDPDDAGDMAAYLRSLEKLAQACRSETGPTRLVPAHGQVIADPLALIAEYQAHRLMREERILRAMAEGPMDLERILARSYADKPKSIFPVARKALRAHLGKLIVERRVEQLGLYYRLRPVNA